MATKQSEFERERQRILAEIETRARKNGGELTLQDWLKAAGEVMPDEKPVGSYNRGTERNRQRETLLRDSDDDVVVRLSSTSPLRSAKDPNQQPPKKESELMTQETPQKKNMVFTSIIFSTLFLLILASGGFAYLHVQKEVAALSENLKQVQAQLGEITLKLQTMEKQQITGGNSIAFDNLVQKVAKLEQKVDVSSTHLPREQVSDQIKSELSASNVITKAELDAKLEQFSKRIEQAIDKRFTTLLAQLKHLNANASAFAPLSPEEKAEAEALEDTQPPSDETEVEIPAPAAPVQPKAPAVVAEETTPATSLMSQDELWLANLPDAHFVLQLASVLDQKRLLRLKKQKGLNDAHIVRQDRNGQIFYVLVSGNYPQRGLAIRAAKAIKNRTGINPWVRQAKDLKRNLPQE